MTNRIVRSIVAPLALTALLSCASDELTNPVFGSGCVSGTIRPGELITGAFNEESCQVPIYWWAGNHVPYTTYRVSLEAGKGYWFNLHQIADDDLLDEVDAVLVLYGRNESGASVPLAASDDDGEGPNGLDSELYFIAPRSGTYNLVTSSYHFSQLGGYQLRMEECPVVASLATAGTHANLAFPASDCVRHDFASTGFDSPVVLVEIPAAANETVGATVTAAGFATAAEMGGPNWDVYNYVYDADSDFSSSSVDPSVLNVTAGAIPGSFTLAVGLSTGVPSGTFTVALTRTPGAGIGGSMLKTPGARAIRAIGGSEAKRKQPRQ